MTTYQILFLTALYAALQGMAYLERKHNKNIHVPISNFWGGGLEIVNGALFIFGLAAVFFYLGAIK